MRKLAGRVILDCSGAIAFVLDVPRKIAGYARGFGGSRPTVIRDADDPAVELVTWGSIDEDGDRDAIGHVGIVAAVPDGWRYTGPAALEALAISRTPASTAIARSWCSPAQRASASRACAAGPRRRRS